MVTALVALNRNFAFGAGFRERLEIVRISSISVVVDLSLFLPLLYQMTESGQVIVFLAAQTRAVTARAQDSGLSHPTLDVKHIFTALVAAPLERCVD